VTTVDVLSNGRAQLSVGAGWYKEEALAYGIEWESFKERIDRMLEALNIILKLWTEETPIYKGKYYSISKTPFWPKPVQKPHPPIWFGGSSNAIIDATARYGDGFLPTTDIPLDKLQDLYNRVRNAEKKYDRKSRVMLASSLSLPDGLGKTLSEWTENVEAQIKAGADLIEIDLSNSPILPAKAHRFLRKFAYEVILEFIS
jgi:alkanesulfonate monooxygenase SsuD/methylene tetrahydromethanopterin reductase-like flavin-dependent oxidoreductase (luciferase family)